MKNSRVLCVYALTLVGFVSAAAVAKPPKVPPQSRLRPMEYPQPAANPSEIQQLIPAAAATAAAETTLLGWWQFDAAGGGPDKQGWREVDMTAQIDTYFHVDGTGGGPGCCSITPVSGQQSMWCGQCSNEGEPYCWWAHVPGYGNNWEQYLETPVLACSTLTFSYTTVWDCEPGYDFVYAEYWDEILQDYVQLPVDGGTGYYDGIGGPLYESFTVTPPNATTHVRFRFESDGAFSDEDGLRPTTEGAFKVDDITLSCPDAGGEFVYFEDFEDEACGAKQSDDGVWRARPKPGFGLYSGLHSGATVVQEDPCRRLISNMFGFFDDPEITNYGCGGWPFQGAMPYGPDDFGRYLDNEIWSPWVPNLGSGFNYILSFKTYRDLPLDNLQFYLWLVRGKEAESNCPTNWDIYQFVYYGGQKDWITQEFEVGSLIPGSTDSIRVELTALDGCILWCGIHGTGTCHSHAPLFDQVKLVRVNSGGPQWNVRHIDLFQDNFPEDGTITGYARADMAQDILPSANPAIVPGDSIAFEVTDPNGLGTDPQFGGPAVYLFARVVDRWRNDLGVSGAAMESPDITRYVGDVNATKRFPYCGSTGNPSAPAGLPAGWHQFRCDEAYTSSGGTVSDRYCGDLMDVAPLHWLEDPGNTGVFLPTHVVRYFLGARNSLDQWSFWHRTFDAGHLLHTMEGQGESDVTLNLAAATNAACEFSILPDQGLGVETRRFYVDDCDDRGGPAQLYFDWAFFKMGLLDYFDRFDVLGPSSAVGNSLASRVKNCQSQLIGDVSSIYNGIFWITGDLSSGLVCDGGPANGGSGPDKSPDWTMLKFFMDFHPNNPSVYFAGDDIAEEWSTLAHPDAVTFRAWYMAYDLVTGNHDGAPSYLPVSPMVYQNTGRPIGPDMMVAYGGCPGINDFDVMVPGGPLCQINSSYGVKDGPYGATMIQATTNPQATTARVILDGFGFNYIRDDIPLVQDDRSIHLDNIDTWVEGTGVTPEPIGADPIAFENTLGNAYPNPFNPTTTIRYSIKEPGHVSLRIYNVAGQLVRTLVDESQAPLDGGFSVEWNGTNDAGGPVSSGVYFYKLTAKDFAQTKKMVLLK